MVLSKLKINCKEKCRIVTQYNKKRLENEILPKFTSRNFKFVFSIVVSFRYHKIKNIH